ncbi:MAG: PHP domain-containing protein [Clostridia bacterium]
MFSCGHDLHCHSLLSSCCEDARMTASAIVSHAATSGYDTVCITDHLWDNDVVGASDWYAPQDIAHVRQSLPLPAPEGVRVLFGCETEYCGGQKLALARPHFDLFDFVVIPVNHMHMRGLVRPMEVDTEEKMAVLFVERLESLLQLDLPFRKIGVAHLTCSLTFREGDIKKVFRAMDKTRLHRVFHTLAERGTGIELNAYDFLAWETDPDTYLRLYRIAKEEGCTFYCASDAHDIEALDNVAAVLPAVACALSLRDADQYIVP